MSERSLRLGVVVLNFNGMADTRICLDSLAPAVGPDFEVVLVDNASSEPLDNDLTSRWPWLHVLRNDANLGYAGGNNTGLRWGLQRGLDWIVLLNNDTRVTPHFAEACRSACVVASRDGVGVWGPLIAFMDEPDVLMTEGVTFNRSGFPGFFETQHVPMTDVPTLVQTDIVNGCCFAVARDVLERVGLIDERLFLVHEESDLCLRVWEADGTCAVWSERLLWHKGSSAFKRSGRRAQRYYDARNLWWLLNRRRAAQRRGRGRAASRAAYARYLWHRYSHEWEHGEGDSARAILEGIFDAWAGHDGPMAARRRPGVATAHRVCGWLVRRRSRSGSAVAA